MNRIKQRAGWTLALVIALVALPYEPAAAQREDAWIDVLSVELDANGIILVVLKDIGELKLADGIHQSDGKIEVVFRDGRLVSVTDRDAFVDSFFLADDGTVMMKVEKGEKPFPSGDYRLQESRRRNQGEERRVIGFRVRNGNFVSVIVDWLG